MIFAHQWRRGVVWLSFSLVPLFGVASAAAAGSAVVTVTPAQLHGWQSQTTLNAPPPTGTEATFAGGPSTPPLGTGSLRLTVGPDGEEAAQLRNPHLHGVRLADLTALCYSTYVAQNNDGQAPYIILNVDQDGNGSLHDLLFFEPVYQTGAYSGDPVPNQGSVDLGVWQDWDALIGGWWSLNDGFFGPPLVTLASYVATYPDARIVNTSTGRGGFRVVAGFGAPSWNDFDGNVDRVIIGVGTACVTYDLDSDQRPFVDVNSTEPGTTSIPNVVVSALGGTIQDFVNACIATAHNHGDYVRCIVALADQLLADGVITAAQRQEMVTGAAQSRVGG